MDSCDEHRNDGIKGCYPFLTPEICKAIIAIVIPVLVT